MMASESPPPALRPKRFNKWFRPAFLSSYLRQIPRGENTLDLACGWGFSFSINPGFYGVELDDESVEFCKQHGWNVRKANLLEPLPLADGFFDNCFPHDVLEHFEAPELEVIFRNVHQVLRPGGMFMNIIPNRRGYDYGVRLDVGHEHFVTPEEISEVASRCSFRYVRT